MNINLQVTISSERQGSFMPQLIESCGIPASRIVVEILESAISEEHELAVAVDCYRELGCLVAIDELGVGESNFDRIWR
ncbi:MAG: EAL domain-containing protein [Pseudomonadota bacterium]|nr:EAL domain-containing protein [Pseudomonadota bacterium]